MRILAKTAFQDSRDTMTPISGDFRLLFHENEKSLPRLKPFGQGTACAQRERQKKGWIFATPVAQNHDFGKRSERDFSPSVSFAVQAQKREKPAFRPAHGRCKEGTLAAYHSSSSSFVRDASSVS